MDFVIVTALEEERDAVLSKLPSTRKLPPTEDDVIFRRGKYTVYVTTIADVESDADSQALTREQKRARKKSEMKRLSKELAKHAAAAIDAP